ncbi:MAG: hypothetical protein GXO12_03995 [Epsilonproteobacteria bacterium]|nr:hypothetical protein [Campylobacterota bacterium]
MSEETKELDEFELKLEQKSKILKECQKEKGLDSCLKCDKIIGCETRNEYVKAVYDSMNKGQSGGFEF